VPAGSAAFGRDRIVVNQVDTAARICSSVYRLPRRLYTRGRPGGGGASLRGLSQLVDKALLQRTRHGAVLHARVLRQYAEEQLKLSVEEDAPLTRPTRDTLQILCKRVRCVSMIKDREWRSWN